MENKCFSQLVSVFQERTTPEEGHLVGYATILSAYDLNVPTPDILSIISHKHKQYKTDQWQVFRRYLEVETRNNT